MNNLTLKILAPVLIIVGVAGYIVPADFAFMSKKVLSNMMYINAGMIGYIVLLANKSTMLRIYNYILGFMLIFLIVSTWLQIFPSPYFEYKTINNFVNINVGAILIFVAVFWSDKHAADQTSKNIKEYSETAP